MERFCRVIVRSEFDGPSEPGAIMLCGSEVISADGIVQTLDQAVESKSLATIVGHCKSSSRDFLALLVRWCASEPTTQATPCPALVPIHARSGLENV